MFRTLLEAFKIATDLQGVDLLSNIPLTF